MTRLSTWLLCALALSIGGCGGGGNGDTPPAGEATPPTQARAGPGGGTYLFDSVRVTNVGAGDEEVWIYEPEGTSTPRPVVLFMHGWSNMVPTTYEAWLQHLAKRGSIVIYPRYQASLLTLPSAFEGNALAGILAALDTLDEPGHATPDLTRVVAVGYSWGGVIASNLAANAGDHGLPPIDALLVALPGTGGLGSYADYSKIPAGTLLLCVAGSDDQVVGETDAVRIYTEATQVGVNDKDLVRVFSDDHGTVPLVADHSFPQSTTVDAFDHRGVWKWLDALQSASSSGADRAYCLGNTPEQRDLGTWGDGVKVREPQVTDTP